MGESLAVSVPAWVVAVRLLAAALPDQETHDPVTWPWWAAHSTHVHSVTDAAADPVALPAEMAAQRAQLRHAAALYEYAQGRYANAIALAEQTLTDRERVLGPDHPHTLDSRNNLADGYSAVGRHQEAIALHEQTLTDRERAPEDGRPTSGDTTPPSASI